MVVRSKSQLYIRFVLDCSFQIDAVRILSAQRKCVEYKNYRGITSSLQIHVVKQVAQAHLLWRGYVLVLHTYVIPCSVYWSHSLHLTSFVWNFSVLLHETISTQRLLMQFVGLCSILCVSTLRSMHFSFLCYLFMFFVICTRIFLSFVAIIESCTTMGPIANP